MQALATLVVIQDEGQGKIIAIAPDSDVWFVNRADLTPEYKEMAEATEKEGKVLVLGMIFTAEVKP